MGLFFEDGGRNKRSWQCFCCGVFYDSLEIMNEHIIASHEKGREYIECPTCHFCIRDLKIHFAVKHPKRIMPKDVQTRVTIWHDFKPGTSKKKKTRKPHFRQGSFSSKKSGCDIHYRSGMEEEFYNLLEQDSDVESYFAEPFKIPYFYNGKWHDYIVDLRINYTDGSTEIWEIKPATQTGPEYEQNQAKWASMHNHAQNMGWQFIVQTEVALGKLKKKIARQRQLLN